MYSGTAVTVIIHQYAKAARMKVGNTVPLGADWIYPVARYPVRPRLL